MKLEVQITETQFRDALIMSSALVADQNREASVKYLHEAKKSILELHKKFVIDQNKYSDKDFMVLKRIFNLLSIYSDDIEDMPEYLEYEKRCYKVNYKTLDSFDEQGKLK
jgi:hypothetical protein